MSTTAPATPQPGDLKPVSKTDSILAMINLALKGITLVGPAVPVVGIEASGAAALAGVFVTMLQHALALWHAETGQPIDLAKIPQEAPVT